MSELYKKRAAARGWLSRACKTLDELLEEKDVDVDALQDAIEVSEKRLTALQSVQEEVERELKEEDLEKDIDEADSFYKKHRALVIKAKKIIKSKDNESTSIGSHASVLEPSLPKLKLPVFDGDIMSWQSFWDQFDAIVHQSDLPDVSKFVYLQSVLKGEALSVIKGLSLTGEHYAVARELLEGRYGRREKLIVAHIQELLNLQVPPGGKGKVSALWILQDRLLSNVRSLEKMGVSGKEYGVVLTPLILSRLPADLRMEWARDGDGKEADLQYLLDFLKKEISRRERSQTFSCSATVPVSTDGLQRVPAATALQTHSAVDNLTCGVCTKRHSTERCWDLKNAAPEERRLKIRDHGLCFRCLGKNHLARGCKARCAKCQGPHHQLLCKTRAASDDTLISKVVTKTKGKTAPANGTSGHSDTVGASDSECKNISNFRINETVMHTHTDTSERPQVLLQIAQVPVLSDKGVTETATVLFDTGSDRTYVSAKFVQKAKPEWVGVEPVSYVAFGSEASSSSLKNLFALHLQCTDASYQSITATEIPTICAPVYRPGVSKGDLNFFKDLGLTCNYEMNTKVEIDILVGLDCYWSLVKSAIVSHQGLVAQETVFGWVLSGLIPQPPGTKCTTTSLSLLCFNEVSEAALHRFWDLEEIGITDKSHNDIDPVLCKFEEDITLCQGRYEVNLPWKTGKSIQLQNNEGLARKRLNNLMVKLAKDPKLKDSYDQYFQDMEAQGMIVEVPPEELVSEYPIFYLPHRPVVRNESLSTKVRPVFDASAPGYNSVSLNDCLHTGPNLLPDLVEILIRFRRWPFGITGDIQKAFLQIMVSRSDQDVHRFLWNHQGTTRHMRFTRVPFGNCSSPFLLNATLSFHLRRVDSNDAVRELQENLYVDDFLSGGDSEEQVCDLIKESTYVLSKAGFTLSKWCSNSAVVSEMLERDFADKNLLGESSVKVLGLKWLAGEDCFSFDGAHFPEGLCITKRVVLSFIARLFDPLGLATPFVMTVKCLFQELWKLGIQWDDLVPPDIESRFRVWLAGLQKLQEWKIPRSYTGLPWAEIDHIDIHGYGDASEKAYGACVYLVCWYQGKCCSSLVLSRARVAPLKKVSLPRLELIAALLCARLVVFVKEALKLPDKIKVSCWSDSQVALTWIKGEPSRWKSFVANRIFQIHELTNPAQWRFCSGKTNPADLVTRGLQAEELKTSELWLSGPPHLMTDNAKSSPDLRDKEENLDLESCMTSEVNLSVAQPTEPSSFLDVERWSSFSKCIRIVAWVKRFLNNTKHSQEKRKGELSHEELSRAKTTFIYCVQRQSYPDECQTLNQGKSVSKKSPLYKLNPFVDSEGLLRVGGRLQFAKLPFEEKHPAIWPKGHAALLLIRFYHFLMKHAGVSFMVAAVQRQYWIIGLRKLAKKVKRQCVSCQRQDTKSCNQPIAPLPGDRVTRAPPFSVSGIDHAGPLYCSDAPKKKFYVLLITCAVVRAIHLELVDSLNAHDTLLALRRFFARRGHPAVIYSDNSKTFKAVQSKLISLYGPISPQWKFIAPRSPWWGGWWERLVKSVKGALRKSLGCKSLLRTELETVLHEVELCINSRPLTFVGDEIDSGSSLTPAHFLMERPAGVKVGTLDEENPMSADQLKDRSVIRSQMLDQFWQIWQSDYLKGLPQRSGVSEKGKLTVGSVVLVREDGLPRLQWPLGIVTAVFPGRDGLIRTVQVRTQKGTYTRSVQLLHKLEVLSGDDSETNVMSGGLICEASNERVTVDVSHFERAGVKTANAENKEYSNPHQTSNSQNISRYGRVRKNVQKLDL